ncbi:MAG: Fe-S cluster assembly ATPase SufC [Actinobacteria bacterium]|nr:Fe-S cluster assembly ATPase SufC [Actinomycetota bacterium]MCL5444820.1 Fe-S cluster assembly ATPase SufC [Actinomycetota bacterium]
MSSASKGSIGLKVHGLKAEVGGHEVLHGIDLEVGPGEVHVVMGPNGSGKSTLAHSLVGRPGTNVTAGEIRVDDVELTGMASFERARAGLVAVLQQPVEVPGVLLESVLVSALSGTDRELTLEEVRRCMGEEAAAIGLEPAILRRPLNVDLSGGEMKRNEMVQIAALRPKYCVLDEIDSGLDVDALGMVASRLERATGEWGLGVLAITHFERLLVELKADAVHVMVDGRIVRSGGPELAQELEHTGYRPYG